MLTDKQKMAIEFAVHALKQADIVPWFEARIIKDSEKVLNGKRISSLKRTDLDSVLQVVEKRKVGMLENMRIELRMYATAAGSRAVFLGQELKPRGVTVTSETVYQLQDEEGDPTLKPNTAVVELPVLGVLNVDNPADPRHQEWGRREGESMADYGQRRQGFVEGRANYSPRKNVERLLAEGLAEDHPLVIRAKGKIPDHSGPYIPSDMHICDANGPMRQRESDGPFLTTCSHCGEFYAGST